MATKEHTNLRHGDVVVLECDGPSGWDGLLSSDPRSRADLEVVYQRKGGLINHPDFLSNCVFRVDTSRGDEAPGTPVNFGDPIRLQLLRTRQFLTATGNPSKQHKRSYRLTFNKNKSKGCHLRLQPHLKIRSEGELVYYGEPLGLLDVNNRFVRPVAGRPATATNPAQPSAQLQPPTASAPLAASSSALDAYGASSGAGDPSAAAGGGGALALAGPASVGVVSNEERHAWRFRRFSPYDASLEHAIVAGDLLRLFHMEEEAFIVGHVVDKDLRARDDFLLDDSNNEKLTELYRRAFVGKADTLWDQKKIFVGLRHSQSKRKARTKHSAMSVWEIQNEQGSAGGPITFNQNIRLRHFSTGYFLCIRSNGNGNGNGVSGGGASHSEAVLLPALADRKDEEDTLFSFEYVSTSEPPVTAAKASGASADAQGAGGDAEGEGGGMSAGAGGGSGVGGVLGSGGSSSSSSAIYCSLLALTRLLHVSSREYVTIGTSPPDSTSESGEAACHNDDADDAATDVSSLKDNEEGGSGSGGEEGGDDDDDDGNDQQEVSNAFAQASGSGGGGGGLSGSRGKEHPLSTSVEKPDESVYQISAVSPSDVDHSFTIVAAGDKVVGFVELATQVLAQSELNLSSQGRGGAGSGGGLKVTSTNGNALSTVKGLQEALSGLVAFVCGASGSGNNAAGSTHSSKWTDAKWVTTPPLKIQQHALVEQGMVELLLMLAQTLFLCVKQVEAVQAAKVKATAELDAAVGPKKKVKNSHNNGKSQAAGIAADAATAASPPAQPWTGTMKHLAKQARRTAAASKHLGSTLPSRAVLNELGILCYKLVMLIVSGNKKCVARIMDCEGIDMMIKHKLATSPSWNPPIKEVLVANALLSKGAAGGSGGAGGIKTVYKTDIKFLLDKVHEKVKNQEVPDAGLFSFLADVCAPNEVPEPDVQSWISELLLGHSPKSAKESCFIYGMRTAEKAVGEADKFVKPASAGGGGAVGFAVEKSAVSFGNDGGVGDIAKEGAGGDDDDDEEEEKWEEKDVEVEVGLLGKLRPTYRPDMAVEFAGVSNVASKSGGVTEGYERISPVVGMTYQQWEDTFEQDGGQGQQGNEGEQGQQPAKTFGTASDPRAVLGGAGKWLPLHSLNLSQLGYLASTLQLLSLVCAGRNASAQLLVKKIVPVDFLLGALWALRDLGQGSHRQKDWKRLGPGSKRGGGESLGAYRDALAQLHASLVSLLRSLHVHSTMVDAPNSASSTSAGTNVSAGDVDGGEAGSGGGSTAGQGALLVWTLGQDDGADDYEDVRGVLTNRIFSAPTQFDEPPPLSNLHELSEAERVVKKFEPEHLLALKSKQAASATASVDTATKAAGGNTVDTVTIATLDQTQTAKKAKAVYAASVLTCARKILRRRWAEFMLLDLNSFVQRSRLRKVIFHTLHTTDSAAEASKDAGSAQLAAQNAAQREQRQGRTESVVGAGGAGGERGLQRGQSSSNPNSTNSAKPAPTTSRLAVRSSISRIAGISAGGGGAGAGLGSSSQGNPLIPSHNEDGDDDGDGGSGSGGSSASLEESPCALSAVHSLLLLIKDLVATDFFNPLYDAYPRYEHAGANTVGSSGEEKVREQPFFYRRTKLMCVGNPAQRGEDGVAAPQLEYSFGSEFAKPPILASPSNVVIPVEFKERVDDEVTPAVPHGMCIGLVANHSLHVYDDTVDDLSKVSRENVTLVLLPKSSAARVAASSSASKRKMTRMTMAPYASPQVSEATSGSGERVKVKSSETENLRAHLRRLQVMLDPRKDSIPFLAGNQGSSSSSSSLSSGAAAMPGSLHAATTTWQALAEDEGLAEEHFKRAYCYLQKGPLDGVLQKERLNILRVIVDVYDLTVTTNQAMRVNSLWAVFQRVFKQEIEDKVFPAEMEEDEEDEDADGDGDDDDDEEDDDEEENDEDNNDEDANDQEEEAKVEEAGGGSDGQLEQENPLGKRGSLNGPGIGIDGGGGTGGEGIELKTVTRALTLGLPKRKSGGDAGADEEDDAQTKKAKAKAELTRYRDKKEVTDSHWGNFRSTARKELQALVKDLASSGHGALMGDFEESAKNKALQKGRGLSFLDLVLYDDDALTARAVVMLQRHFNRRVELSGLLLQSTLVLEEKDKDTLKFVGKRKLELQRALMDFANPYDTSHVRDKTQKHKLTQRRLRCLANAVSCLLHDPSWSDRPVGLTNLCWMDDDKTSGDDDDDDDDDEQDTGSKTASSTSSGMQQQQQGKGGQGLSDMIFVVTNEFGEHPLVRGLPRREALKEMNQQILAEQQVHAFVLEFLGGLASSFSGGGPEEFNAKLCAEQRQVVQACLVFLFYFVYDHNDNAMLLSNGENLSTLLLFLPLWSGTEAVVLLTEILVDNSVANACLEESHIKGFVAMLVQAVKQATVQDDKAREHRKKKFGGGGVPAGEAVKGGDWTKATCLLALLSTVIETDEGPVTARQELVVQVLEEALQMQDASPVNLSQAGVAESSSTVVSGNSGGSGGGAGGGWSVSGSGGGFSPRLLASFLFIEPAKLQLFLDQRQTEYLAAVGDNKNEDGTGGSVRSGGSGGSDSATLDGLKRLTPDDVVSLYEVKRVEKEYERLTRRKKPPRKGHKQQHNASRHASTGVSTAGGGELPEMDPLVGEWVKSVAGSKPMPDDSHLAFHVKFVDVLGMLAKGDCVGIEQWCALFVPKPALLLGLQSRHYILKGSFLRCLHGVYFSRQFGADDEDDNVGSGGGGGGGVSSGGGINGDGDDDDYGDLARDQMFSDNQAVFSSLFSDMNGYLRLLYKLQKVSFEMHRINEEEEDFENVVVDVVLPFLGDFFNGNWPLVFDQSASATPAEVMDELRNSLAATAAASGGGGGGGSSSGTVTPTKNKDFDHAPRSSLLRTCALKEHNNIVLNLAKLGKTKGILGWENARLGVEVALDAARQRRLGGVGAMSAMFMVSPESDLSTKVQETCRKIEDHAVLLETEGIDGDEKAEVKSQRRKKEVVKKSLPHFIECFHEVVRGEGSTSATSNSSGGGSSSGGSGGSTASVRMLGGYTGKSGSKYTGGGNVDTARLLDARKDPFFEVFVDTIRSRVMNTIRAQADNNMGGSGGGGGGGGVGFGSNNHSDDGGNRKNNAGPSSGLLARGGGSGGGDGINGAGASLSSSVASSDFATTATLPSLGEQLAALTGGQTIGDALEVIEERDLYSNRAYENRAYSEDGEDESEGSGVEDLIGGVAMRIFNRDNALSEEARIEKAANEQARSVAFNVFTKSSQRYVEKLLRHLCQFVGNEFTDCDMYLCGALQSIMSSRREEIEAEYERTPSMTKAQLSSDLDDNDLVCKLMQCTFINLGGPESVMSLVSLGAQADDLNAYYKRMVPCANELGNAMLEGGNYEVQRRFFEIFVQKKSSFESHREESFLRSLQAQLRDLRKLFLNPNLDLKNSAQLCATKKASKQAVTLLKFIQNLVEGHQTAHQEFMLVQPSVTETVNIVKEVGSFYLALFEGVESEFLKIVDDRDFNAKHAPPVAGQSAAAASSASSSSARGGTEGGRGGGGSGGGGAFGRFKIVAWHRNLNFVKLKLVMPVLVGCLQTMQEFCAGPCLKNQLALVRTGVCNTFPTLFTFFGALQLRQDAPPVLKKTASSLMASTAAAASNRSKARKHNRERASSHLVDRSEGGKPKAGSSADAKGGSSKVGESPEVASFRETWAVASHDLFYSSLQESSLGSAVTGTVGRAVGIGFAIKTNATGTLTEDKSSYVMSFGKGLAPGSKWVGNDPALLFLLFRLRMEWEKKQKLRSGSGFGVGKGGGGSGGVSTSSSQHGADQSFLAYPDEQTTLLALLGPLTAEHDHDGDGREESLTPPRGSVGGAFTAAAGGRPLFRSVTPPRTQGTTKSGSVGNDDAGGRGSVGGNHHRPHHHEQKVSSATEPPNDFNLAMREGGWVRAKRDFVKLNTEEKWRPQKEVGGAHGGGEWRFKRKLRALRRNIYSDIEVLTEDALCMEEALVVFLLSLVEGGDVHGEVKDNVLSNWDTPTMLGNTVNWLGVMEETSSKFGKDLNATTSMNAARNRISLYRSLALNYHILVESMADTGNMLSTFKQDYRELCTLRGLRLSSNKGVPVIGRVEVLGKNDQVSVMYFPVPPIVSTCWMRPEVQQRKEEIVYPDDTSNRGNPDEKIKNFLEESDDLIDILEHEYMLHEMRFLGLFGRCIAELGRRSWLLSYVTLVLSLLINGFLLTHAKYDQHTGDEITGLYVIERTGLPHIHAATSVLLLFSYSVSSGWRNVIVGQRENPDGVLAVRGRFQKKLARFLLPLCIVQNDPYSSMGGGGGGNGGTSGGDDGRSRSSLGMGDSSEVALLEIPWVLRAPFFYYTSDWRAVYYSVFVLVSLWGVLVNPLAFALCMFDVVRMSSTMQKVIRAFTKNLDQVVVTVVFMVILLYMFAAFAFNNNLKYEFEEHSVCGDFGDDGKQNCGGKFSSWLLLHIDYGVINPLVFTDNDGPISTPEATVFGFLYYFLINLVITAIVSGIIIDTFAQMRSDKNEVVEDLRTACFICDIEPEDFEQFNVRFADHIKNDHNIWQYVWLKIHLREKDRTLYSGTEMHVAPYLERHSPRCMPIKKSRAILGKVKSKATLPTILHKISHVFAVAEHLANSVEELRSRVEKRGEDTNARIQDLATTTAALQQQMQPAAVMAGGEVDGRGGSRMKTLSSMDEPAI